MEPITSILQTGSRYIYRESGIHGMVLLYVLIPQKLLNNLADFYFQLFDKNLPDSNTLRTHSTLRPHKVTDSLCGDGTKAERERLPDSCAATI